MCEPDADTTRPNSDYIYPLMVKLNKSFLKSGWLWLAVALFFSNCSGGNPAGNRGTLQKAIDAADETSAIQTLRTIASAQAQAKAIRGSYADFAGLVDGGFLDQRFATATPTLRGYRFTMSASSGEFSVTADPAGEATGRHFYLDSNDDAIHVNATGGASKSDPTL